LVNPCKTIKEDVGDDIKYAMRVSRKNKREYGFPLCKLPNGDIVAGHRRLGGSESVMLHPETQCGENKHIGSFHVHPPPSSNEQSIIDAVSQRGDKEKIACIGSAFDGKMACYGQLPVKEINKMVSTYDQFNIKTEPQLAAFNELITPTLEAARSCEIEIEKVGALKKVKEKFRAPKLPPLKL
jgi:hypothetical protein